MAEFKIGGKVLCVKTSNSGWVKRGKVYTVSDIATCCERILMLKGVSRRADSFCRKCKRESPGSWFLGSFFIPLEGNQELSSLTVEELLEQMEPQTA